MESYTTKWDLCYSKWEIIRCDFCGSQGSHVACKHLLKMKRLDICADCHAIEHKARLEKVKSPKKKKSIEMPYLEVATSPEGQKEGGSPYPGPSNRMRKIGLPNSIESSPEAVCPTLSPQDKISTKHKRMSEGDGKKKGKRASMASPEGAAAKSKRPRMKCETITLSRPKADNLADDWSSDDDLSLAKRKNKFSSEKQQTCTSDVKRKYKKRKSVENDSSQTTITQWFKAKPAESRIPSKNNEASQTSIIKWFKNRSTHLDNIASQSISKPASDHSVNKTFVRPKTAWWKGRQLVIKSPRVVLYRSNVRLGKVKPKNLFIDMNDRKGTSSKCDQDYLTMIDSKFRLTRNMVQSDRPHVMGPRNPKNKLKKVRLSLEPRSSPCRGDVKQSVGKPQPDVRLLEKSEAGKQTAESQVARCAAQTARPKHGELTPTSQIHKAFDFSTEKVNRYAPGSLGKCHMDSPSSACKTLSLNEPSASGGKRLAKLHRDRLLLEFGRRSPRGHKARQADKTSVQHGENTLCIGSELGSKDQDVVSESCRSSPRLKAQSADEISNVAESTNSSSIYVMVPLSKWESPRRKVKDLSPHKDVDTNLTIPTVTKWGTQSPKKTELLGSRNDSNSPSKPNRPSTDKVPAYNADEEQNSTSEIGPINDTNCSSNGQYLDKDEKMNNCKPVTFTKLSQSRSPRIADFEVDKCLLPSGKAFHNSEIVDLSSKKDLSQNEHVCKFFDFVQKPSIKDHHYKQSKVLRPRSRSSTPDNRQASGESNSSILWSLPGTRQLMMGESLCTEDSGVVVKPKLTPQSLDFFTQENKNPNIKSSDISRNKSLPFKKRKSLSTKLDVNSDIRDFLGKGNSMFFSKPLNSSRSSSECSDIDGTSDICKTALKLSPSYVTKFRRSHSRTEGSDVSQSVIQNLSTFESGKNWQDTNTQEMQNEDCVSDKFVMKDYYDSSLSVNKRRSLDSVCSVQSDDSDLMIISPVLETNTIEIT